MVSDLRVVDIVRRLWRYPENWRSLTDDGLWQLIESGGR